MTGVKVVLWISRHKPLPSQIQFLKNKLGDFELVIHDKPLSTASDAVELVKKHNADFVVPVLPLSFIAHLVQEAKKHNFTVLRAEMENIHNCDSDNCPDFNPETDTIMISKDFNDPSKIIRRHFRFKEFVKLKDIQIITEPL